ncbi:MAG: ribonuclease HII [Flavobacteriales bacterium]|jgi:ribonuclease HII|nr:ribonuclease HII [Flavobacteriales bacterium]
MALEKQWFDGIEAGTDEAGRGCLAGPVTAAAVILPSNFTSDRLNDSKKLSLKVRLELKEKIEQEAVAFAVAHVFPEEIDQINILNASIKAMHLALAQLQIVPEHILVDGNRFHPYADIPHQCMIKGDGRFLNIAAASVLAKTARDAYMANLHKDFPAYQWDKNKGYPTRAHREAIQKWGSNPHHRKSFRLLPEQLVLNL